MKRLHQARMFLGVESMNTTESLDGTGKSPDLSSATGETAIPGDTSITENKRRRLVRGAVAFAPLVLTLRSGALAAASCTGVKIQNVAVQPNSTPPHPPNDPFRGKIQTTVELAEGDLCVRSNVLRSCDAPDETKVLTSSPINTNNSQPVVKLSYQGTDFWTCGSGPRRFQGQNVAILSSSSVTSMGVRVINP